MMPSHTSLLVFTGAALVLLAIPGPAVFYILVRSIGQGSTAGVVSALGIAVGTLFHVTAAVLGRSAVSPAVRTAATTTSFPRLAAYIVNYADDLVICCRGVRVVGSWIVASGLLVLGWNLRGKF